MQSLGSTFWGPLFLAIASAAFGIFWNSTDGLDTTTIVAAVVCVLGVIFAFIAARHAKTNGKAGEGGKARAFGQDSSAIGGDGGHGNGGGGGGDAVAVGKRASAKGGRGGDV